MIVEIEIKPIIDHKNYKIGEKVVYKDLSGIWQCNEKLAWAEKAAFRSYAELILKNPNIKKHPNAIYRIDLVTLVNILTPIFS